jgi:hypothetical protein
MKMPQASAKTIASGRRTAPSREVGQEEAIEAVMCVI